MNVRRNIIVIGAAVLVAVGLAFVGTSPATAGSPPRAVDNVPPRARVQPPPASELRQAGRRLSGLTQVRYSNWGGYADSGTNEKYTKVSSTFIQPALTCDKSASGYQITVFWDGIDGFNNGRVEQGGTEGYCHNGSGPFYLTWWEEYPTNDIQDVGTTVKAGDKITVSVVRTGTKYTVKVTDATTPANTFSKSFSCAAATCPDASVEWVAEAPGDPSTGSLYPLVKFAKWTNSNSVVANAATTGNITSFPDDEITMVNNSNQVKAQPGPLNGAGTSFSVTYKRSS